MAIPITRTIPALLLVALALPSAAVADAEVELFGPAPGVARVSHVLKPCPPGWTRSRTPSCTPGWAPRRVPCPCPPAVPGSPTDPTTPTPDPDVPGSTPSDPDSPDTPRLPDQPEPFSPAADFSNMANLGNNLPLAASTPLAIAPGMIGDALGGENLFLEPGQDFVVPTPGNGDGGASIGRQKIAENTSPMPRDRVFVNYSYFDNTTIFNGNNIHRVSPGFEKTFLGGRGSVEMRFPFADTVDSNIFTNGTTDTENTEFGNITLYLKGLLWGGNPGDVFAISGGLGIGLPTADDVRVINGLGVELINVENEAVHLIPFVGGLYTPNDRFFAQGFIQVDADANGNPVHVLGANGALTNIGTSDDVTFLFVDIGVGWWMFRSNDPNQLILALAPTVEMHYNRSLSDTDVLVSGVFRVGEFNDAIEVFNAVVGVTAECRNNIFVTAGYAVPVGGGADQQFDGEARVIVNWLFGRPNRFARGPF